MNMSMVLNNIIASCNIMRYNGPKMGAIPQYMANTNDSELVYRLWKGAVIQSFLRNLAYLKRTIT